MSKQITARWDGTCAKCGQPFSAGDTVVHAGKRQTFHPQCSTGSEPIVLKEDPVSNPRRGGPSKTRTVVNVDGLAVTFDTGETEQATDLKRPERKAAVDFAFPGNGAITKGLSNEALVEVLKGERTLQTPQVKAERATQAHGVEQAILDLVTGLQAQATVDEDAVRRIVDEAVKAHTLPRDLVVHAPQKDPVTISGHTHKVLPKVISALSLRLPVLLVGPAGSGKSTLAFQAFQALGLESNSTPIGPTTPTSKFFGFVDANGVRHETGLSRAFVGGQGILADELDNGHPGLVTELNQALANDSTAFAWGEERKHEDFVFVGTANTFGRGPDRLFVGRNILDAATLDRFVVIEVLVDESLEEAVALAAVPTEHRPAAEAWVRKVQAVRAKVTEQAIPLVVSPRASINGVRLIATGDWTPEEVAEAVLWKGAKADIRAKVS